MEQRNRRHRAAVAVALALLLGAPAAPAGAMHSDADLSSRPERPPSEASRPFWVADKHRYRSPWYAGAHRKMIPWGCTRAPFYPPDPRCPKRRGFHHGIDIAMRCGTELYAGYRGRVVRPSSAGELGPAYGPNAFRLRNFRLGRDFVIGHTRRVFVEPGDRVRRGERIALASDAAAPDGCHLHFEVRPMRAPYTAAVDPRPYLRLRRR